MLAARAFWLTIIIWIIVGWIIDRSFKLGFNPLIGFIFQIVLLFLVAFFVRVGAIKLKVWWARVKLFWAIFFRNLR